MSIVMFVISGTVYEIIKSELPKGFELDALTIEKKVKVMTILLKIGMLMHFVNMLF